MQKQITSKMESALSVLENQLKGLRTGRASVNLLDPVSVEVYGSKIPISQVGTVSTPDAKTIVVQVWDKNLVKAVEKAVVDANLGLSPVSDGQLVRMSIPALTQERREELVKLAYKYGENSKIAIRNIRRDANEELKKLEKANEISKDEHKKKSEDVQKVTDDFIAKIDTTVKKKEQDILTI